MRPFLLALLTLLAASACLRAGNADAAQARRIVSINLCADELVLRLADRQHVAAVTWLARDPAASTVWEEAAQVGINHGLAEEVLLYRPDLILAGQYTTRTTVAFLRRTGMPVMELGVPQTLEEVYAQILSVATALGHEERGEEMVAAMEDSFAALAPPPAEWRPRAFVLRPNGFTVGPGSLVDSLLVKAGLTNAAGENGLFLYGQIPLETVILEQADLLIIDADARDHPALAMEVLHHPALQRLGERIEILALPSRLWTCPGPMLVETVKQLAEAAERVRARRRNP
ncbi:ABC transporter substrate-binding protein [Telmatospirillum sp. J64-1]|uniref:ABC transporter substrate-binding protein n=1 Tax=Telmatospirillum sp. J64-1 TaxID=2502183 RepID=UPI00115E4BEE|nr:ABC transporter substrate-binding protein [Telmatospirillum sp. J64-1]